MLGSPINDFCSGTRTVVHAINGYRNRMIFVLKLYAEKHSPIHILASS